MSALLEAEALRVDLPLGRGLLGRLAGAPARRLTILDGVTLALGPGETLGVAGESGSGKTTLARALLGLRPITGGRLRFEGREMPAALPALRRGAAMMFQDAAASLSPRMRLGRAVTEPLAIHAPGGDRGARAAELLALVGLPAAVARRYPHELSGGQARRAALARALALSPRLLIADEPTAGLDVSVQGEALNLLADLRDRLGLSLLVISHNLAALRHAADRLAVLYLGQLMEEGPAEALFAAPLHPYTASLIAAEPHPDPRRRRADLAIRGEVPSLLQRPSGCAFRTRCPRAAPACAAEAPALREAGGRRVRCHFPLR